ncbi:MAG: glutamyl-tRNA amidotransferase [Ignavibacteria bacterium GWA2_55_25]|nr:MAG: glutamyl-tRNA amidotransferase [Ignavibacteria bacterium GWA2_55_25]
MTLSERITADMKDSMKSGKKLRLETLRTIRAQIIELTKRGSDKPITVDDELGVLMVAMKKRKEAIELYEKAGRNELARQEQEELKIISSYLPAPLTREEAEKVVETIIRTTGAATAKDFGKVMPLAMKELKGKIDGKIVQELVKGKLGG